MEKLSLSVSGMKPFDTTTYKYPVAHSTATNAPSITGRGLNTQDNALPYTRSMPSKTHSMERKRMPCDSLWISFRNRVHNIGVRVTLTIPEIRIAVQMVT